MRRPVGSLRLAWAARVALLTVVGCVPDSFVFEQGGQSASGAGGFGGSGGVGGGSGGQGGQGGSSGSAIPAEPKCGDGLVNGDEECDLLNPIDDQVFEDELSDALPEPLDLGCTHDCRRIVTWHQDIAVPGGRPVAVSPNPDAPVVTVAGNAPALTRRFFADVALQGGALTDLRMDAPGTFIHNFVYEAYSFLLASDAVDTPSPSTFIDDLIVPELSRTLSFDFDTQAVARYGRAASMTPVQDGMSLRLFVLGSSAGSVQVKAIDYLNTGFAVYDMPITTPLVGPGPGALFWELGDGADGVSMAWADTLVRLVPPERSAKVPLPDAMINGGCKFSATSGLVVGDYDAGGDRAMFAATYSDIGAQLTLDVVEVPYAAPSRALATACRYHDAFVVGEAEGGAFTLRWADGQWRERRMHHGPGHLPAGATAVALDKPDSLAGAIVVAGWHQTAAGEFPWVQRYAL